MGSESFNQKKRMKASGIDNHAGFTLVELIVVLVILAILAAFTIPTYLGYVAKTKETLCISQRGQFQRLYCANRRINDGLDIAKFITANYDGNFICPGSGSYKYEPYFTNEGLPLLNIVCSVHDSNPTDTLRYRAIELYEKIKNALNWCTNGKLREEYLKEHGGKWEAVDPELLKKTKNLKKEELYVQPYVTGDGTVFIYASNSDGGPGKEPWKARMVYNHEDGKWYERLDDGLQIAGYTNPEKDWWSVLKSELSDPTKFKAIN